MASVIPIRQLAERELHRPAPQLTNYFCQWSAKLPAGNICRLFIMNLAVLYV